MSTNFTCFSPSWNQPTTMLKRLAKALDDQVFKAEEQIKKRWSVWSPEGLGPVQKSIPLSPRHDIKHKLGCNCSTLPEMPKSLQLNTIIIQKPAHGDTEGWILHSFSYYVCVSSTACTGVNWEISGSHDALTDDWNKPFLDNRVIELWGFWAKDQLQHFWSSVLVCHSKFRQFQQPHLPLTF